MTYFAVLCMYDLVTTKLFGNYIVVVVDHINHNS